MPRSPGCVASRERGRRTEVVEEGRLRTTPETFLRRFASERPKRKLSTAGGARLKVSRHQPPTCERLSPHPSRRPSTKAVLRASSSSHNG